MDKVGHRMTYQFGHNTMSLSKVPAAVEHALPDQLPGCLHLYQLREGMEHQQKFQAYNPLQKVQKCR